MMKMIRIIAFALLILVTIGTAFITCAWVGAAPIFMYDFNTDVAQDLSPEAKSHMTAASAALARLIVMPLAITTVLWIAAFIVLWRTRRNDKSGQQGAVSLPPAPQTGPSEDAR